MSKDYERGYGGDANYGSQAHQRDFALRAKWWQIVAPCPKSHTHNPDCYSAEMIAGVLRSFLKGDLA